MPKRKREAEIEDEISQIPDQALRIRVSRLKARFEHGVSQLTAQLKLARGFDRQKMTRRLKQAGSDQAKVERLNAEIQVLKDFKEAKVARTYLIKQCSRTKRIAESDAFVALFGIDPETNTKGKAANVTVAEGNVLGRLFKVEAVSKVVPEIMKGIRDVVGVDKPIESKVQNSTGDFENRNGKQTMSPKLATEDDDFAGFSDEPDQTPASNNLYIPPESGDDGLSAVPDDDLLASYDDRLAASSDEDDENEVGAPINGQDHDRINDMEITTDDGEGSESDAEAYSLSDHDSRPVKPVKLPIVSTSFLPSLMHGGYYSGSDSDGESDPDAAFATLTKPERKNRRGQKARQAIAEKKFGTRAKHLVKANGTQGVHGDRQRLIQSQERNDGWDARKGAVSSIDRKPGRGKENSAARAPNRFERRNGYAKVNSEKRVRLGPRPEPSTEKPRPVKPSEKLHPSWEAARKKKLEGANAGTGSFAGKKITFD